MFSVFLALRNPHGTKCRSQAERRDIMLSAVRIDVDSLICGLDDGKYSTNGMEFSRNQLILEAGERLIFLQHLERSKQSHTLFCDFRFEDHFSFSFSHSSHPKS
ncbi:DNA-directed RNA polymerase [Echinococcus multilocularis]|uniref:DNA-directed RNA polymerase n=1 Tax=Echinococcus multilocularis TaxID=6211 RepID=A0A0S4MI26_ECHMU|nr:DNA-directed RNA polymerase [Echinococcus multilocularis]